MNQLEKDGHQGETTLVRPQEGRDTGIDVREHLLQQILIEMLMLRRSYSRLTQQQLAEKMTGLPSLLRGFATKFEVPPEDLPIRETHADTGYSLWTDTYDQVETNEVILGEEEIIWPLIGDVCGKRALDAGCGTGRHSIPLVQKGATVVASEPTDAMLLKAQAKASAKGLDVSWRRDTIDSLPAELGQFDLVLCCLVLSHVENFHEAVAKLASYVRPGGNLILTDFHPFCMLLGLRSYCYSGGQKILVPNFIHLPSEYVAALARVGLRVTDFLEPANIPELPGIPSTLIIKATKFS